MPCTACRRERCFSRALALVMARSRLSAWDRCCPLVSPGSCPNDAPGAVELGILIRLPAASKPTTPDTRCSSMIITSIHPHPRITRTGTREGADAGQFAGQSTVSAGDGALRSAVLRSVRGVKLMSNNASPAGMQVNRSLLVGGGVLVGVGGLLGFTGMVLVGSALLSATRQWVNQLEQPPSELARRRWQQAKAAASAGAGAWRNGPQTRSAPS